MPRGCTKWVAVALIATCSITLPQVCIARDPAVVAKEAANEVGFELAECAAYYVIGAAATEASLPPGSKRDAMVAEEKRIGETALDASARLTSQAVAGARKWENYSIILAKYMYPCKDRVEAPDRRFTYWLKEKEKLPDVSSK